MAFSRGMKKHAKKDFDAITIPVKAAGALSRDGEALRHTEFEVFKDEAGKNLRIEIRYRCPTCARTASVTLVCELT